MKSRLGLAVMLIFLAYHSVAFFIYFFVNVLSTSNVEASTIAEFDARFGYMSLIQNLFPSAAMVLGIWIIIYTGREFTLGTLRRHLADGLQRVDFLVGKWVIIVLFSVVILLTNYLIYFTGNYIFVRNLEAVFSYFQWSDVVHFIAYAICYSSMALVFVCLIRGPIIAAILFWFYDKMEALATTLDRRIWGTGITELLPTSVFAHIIASSPISEQDLFLSIFYVAIFMVLSTWWFLKSDIQQKES